MSDAGIVIRCCRGNSCTDHRFEHEIVVGRRTNSGDSEVDLDVGPDRSVSRRHARLWVHDNRCWIEDLGSQGGTLVGNRQIRELGRQEIFPGDSVHIGQSTLELVAVNSSHGRIRADVSCESTFTYSLVHCDIPFVDRATIRNDGSRPIEAREVEIVLRDYARSVPVTIGPLSGNALDAFRPKLSFDRSRLRDLTAPATTQLEVWANSELISAGSPVEVTVLPPNAWYWNKHEQALAGFVMPNTDVINAVVNLACSPLADLLPGAQGFADALESADPRACEATLEALYVSLKSNYCIRYEYEPRTYGEWQAIRFHQEVLDRRAQKGTCIELALLFAACVENVHRDPLVIIVENGARLHAVVGCWKRSSPLTGSVLYDDSQLRHQIVENEILVLDSQGIARARDFPEGMTFGQAGKSGRACLESGTLRYAIDVVAARHENIAPMPFGGGLQWEPAAWSKVFQARRRAEADGGAPTARHLLLSLLADTDALLRKALASFGEDCPSAVVTAAEKSLGIFAHESGGAVKRADLKRSSLLRPTQDWENVLRYVEQRARIDSTLPATEADLAEALLHVPSRVEDVLKKCELTSAQVLDALRRLDTGTAGSRWHSSGFAD